MRSMTVAIVTVSCLAFPIVSVAEQEEFTMEVIESMDAVNDHHRIPLPKPSSVVNIRTEVKDNNADRSRDVNVQRKQLKALIAEGDSDRGTGKVAHQQEHRQNTTRAVASESDRQQLHETAEDYRKEMAERSQDIVDELREDNQRTTSSAALGDER